MKNFVCILLIILFVALTGVCISYQRDIKSNRPNYINNTVTQIDYSQFDLNNINAVREATKAYKKNYRNQKGTKVAKDGYKEFLKFYVDFLAVQHPKIVKECEKKYSSRTFHKHDKNGVPYIISLPWTTNEFGKKYEKYGFTIIFDEDFFYPSISYKYLYNNFAPYLPKEDKILMKFDMEHFDKTWISDNHFVVAKEEIEYVLKFYQQFKTQYPEYSKEININETIDNFQKDLKCFPNAYPCLYK